MLSTCFGVAVFLTVLLSAAHIVLNLWTLNTLDAVAYDAAHDIAVGAESSSHLAELEQEASAFVRRTLGAYGERVDVDIERRGTESIAVTVRGPSLSLMPRRFAAVLGLDKLERTSVVTVEDQPW